MMNITFGGLVKVPRSHTNIPDKINERITSLRFKIRNIKIELKVLSLNGE